MLERYDESELLDLIEGFLRLIESDRHEPVNIGNPGEFTILELAEVIIRVTGSRSEIVYEALPQDDPTVRRPDITLAQRLLDWGPTVELDEGLRLTLAGMGREPGASTSSKRGSLPFERFVIHPIAGDSFGPPRSRSPSRRLRCCSSAPPRQYRQPEWPLPFQSNRWCPAW